MGSKELTTNTALAMENGGEILLYLHSILAGTQGAKVGRLTAGQVNLALQIPYFASCDRAG